MNDFSDIFERGVVGERYCIKERLGTGVFGEVFKASYEVFGIPLRTVALKLFKGKFVTEKNAKEVFKEALILESLVAEARARGEAVNLVTVYDIGVFKDYYHVPYVAMEFVNGGSLEDELRRARRFPLATTIRYGREISAGLLLAHEALPAIIHRDLKPANLLVTRNGFIKVSDFGVAIDQTSAFIEGGGGEITYAAPELRLNTPATPAYDVYALGVTMVEFLLGYNPIGREAERARERAKREGCSNAKTNGIVEEAIAQAQEKLAKFEDPETGRPFVEMCAELRASVPFQTVLKGCLALTPSSRFAHARALDEALAKCQSGEGEIEIKEETFREKIDRLLREAERNCRTGHWEKAEHHYNEVLVQDPRNLGVFFGLAEVYENLNRLEDACCMLKRGAEYADTKEGYERLVYLCEKAGKSSEARFWRKRADMKD